MEHCKRCNKSGPNRKKNCTNRKQQRLNRTEKERYGGSIGLGRAFLDNRLNLQANYRYSPHTTYTVQPKGVNSSSTNNISPHRFSITARYQLKWGNSRARINKAKHDNSETSRM